MKPRPFRFRLARVLRVREVEEELLRSTWGAAEREALEAEQRLSGARTELATACAELAREQLSSNLAPGEVLAADRLLELRRGALPALAQRAAAAREAAELRREEWMGSRQDLRSLETFRERARSRHRETQNRAEAAAMDEVAATQDERRRRRQPVPVPVPVPVTAQEWTPAEPPPPAPDPSRERELRQRPPMSDEGAGTS